MSGHGPDLTLEQLDSALAKAFGRPGASVEAAPPADNRVKVLTDAGLTVRGAEQVLDYMDRDGLSAQEAMISATAFGPEGKVADRSVSLETLRRRVAEALSRCGPGRGVSEAVGSSAGTPSLADDHGLRQMLREALTPRYGASAGAVADGALAQLQETAVREGLTREQFVTRAYELARHIKTKGRGTPQTAGESRRSAGQGQRRGPRMVVVERENR